jgi:hypothetical protein
MRVVLRPDAGSVAIPERAAEEGYAYLGPAGEVTQADELRIVAGDDVAPELVATIRREAEVALRYYRERLARPGREPAILVATSPGPPSLGRGRAPPTPNPCRFCRERRRRRRGGRALSTRLPSPVRPRAAWPSRGRRRPTCLLLLSTGAA